MLQRRNNNCNFQTWVADDITLNLAPDLYGNRDKEDLTRLEKTRTAVSFKSNNNVL